MENDPVIRDEAAGRAIADGAEDSGPTDISSEPTTPEADLVLAEAVEAINATEARLDEVDQALARIDAGTYGTCQDCGGAIDDARLADAPTALTCGACLPAPPASVG
jgi:RNA polymerase-binding transcription factor DksA